jgi:hypothetical protein
LIDADTFRELDFFELAPEHFRMCRIFAGVVVDQIASRISHLPGSSDGVPARQPAGFIVPSAAGFRQWPPVLLVGADIQAGTVLSGPQRHIGEGRP